MECVEGIEDHMAEEKFKKISKIAKSSILESFSALESDVEGYRITAGVALLRELSVNHHENEDKSLAPELNYTLNRLIRGLGGTKTSKRAGCFSALVGILSTLPTITIEDLIERTKKDVHASSDVNKSEQTGAYVSQLLVCGAIIHSGIFLKANLEEQLNVLTVLFNVWKKKKEYLSLVVSSFLRDLLEKVDEKHFRNIIWPLLKPEVSKSWQEHSLESLHLLMDVREKFPEVVKKKFLVEHLNCKTIIHEETFGSCCTVLLNTPLPLCRGHPILDDVCRHVTASNLMIPFWETLVGDFRKRPSSNREEVLIRCLDLFLQFSGDKNKVPEFLNDIFMEQVIKTLKAKGAKGDLYQKLKKVFIKMTEFMKGDDIEDDVRVAFLKRLLLYPGNVMFDKLAGTNFVFLISSQMKMDGIKQMAHIFRDIISAVKPKITNSTGETCSWNKFERVHVVRLFTRLLSLPVVLQHQKWRVKQTIFLFSIGLFAPPADEPAERRLVLSGDSRDAIFKVLDIRAPSLSQLCSYLNSVVHQLHEHLFDSAAPAKLSQPFTDTSTAAWHKMMSVVRELESCVSDSEKSEKQVFHVLFLHMGLQLFQNASLAEETLVELHLCFERTLKKGERKKEAKLTNGTEGQGGEEPHWVEVVVDLFLSLLSRNSHLLRNVVTSVFPYLCPHLTRVALFQILEVLNPFDKRPMKYEDAEEGEESDDSEEEKESDIETENTEEGKDSDLSDDEDPDEDLGDEPVNMHLKIAVQKALTQAGGADSDQESVNIDDMTEEEGRRLDEALSSAFKLLRKSNSSAKKKQSKDDETLMNFRVRVMDLLDIIVVTKPELGRLLDLLLPLFDVLEFSVKDSHQAPLERRVRQCLKKLCSVKQFSSAEGVDQEQLVEVLEQLLQKGERAAAVFQNMGEPLVQCSTFIARTAAILAHDGATDTGPVQNVFIDALNTFFKKRDSLLPLDVFKSILHLSWNGAWTMVRIVMDFAFALEIRPFRRHQALQLLIAFYSNDRLLVQVADGNKKNLQKLEKTLSRKVLEILSSEAESKTATHKDKFMEELLTLLVAVHLAHSRHKTDEVASCIDWEAVKKAVRHYGEGSEMSRGVRRAYCKLARALHMSVELTKKNQKQNEETTVEEDSNEEEEEEEGEKEDMEVEEEKAEAVVTNGVHESESGKEEKAVEKKVKRRKRQKMKARNRAELKKQSRHARYSAMAEGLEDFDFSAVNVSDIQEIDVTADKKSEKRKLKSADVSEDEGDDNLDVENRVLKNAKKFRNDFRSFKAFKKKSKG